MIKKIKQLLTATALLVLSLGFLPIASAAGNNVIFSADSIINLTGSSLNLTIASGSQVAGYTVNASSVDFSLENGSLITVFSTDFKTLTNNLSLATSCANGYTYITYSATTTQTLTITPAGTTTCTAGGSQGSSGGGGGTLPVGGGNFVNNASPTVFPTSSSSSPAGRPNGTLILDGSTIFLIKNGKKYGFRDPAEYNSHGYKFEQAVSATSSDKSLVFDSKNIIKALEGTLVLDSSDGKTVYMVGLNGTKRGFASGEVFKALGYSFENLPKINMTDYASGDPIKDSIATHPEGALVKESNGTVWWILSGKKQGFESMEVFNTYGFPTSRIVTASTSDLALPAGDLVKFRDGTLVKDGESYYIISDGKKLKFSSSTDLTNKGYKLSNVITSKLTTYSDGGTLQ